MARLDPDLKRSGAQLLLWLLPLTCAAALLSAMSLWQGPKVQRLHPALVDRLLDETAPVAAKTSPVGSAPPDLTIPPLSRTPELEVRVMLHRSDRPVFVGSTGRTSLQSADGAVLMAVMQPTSFQCRSDRLQAGNSSGSAEQWLQASPGQHVVVAGQRYRGRLRLICQGNRFTVINHLPLEDYIASVVGAEMPSHWHPEALQAQAVAARSYAMAHLARPADPHWTMGATTRWQAYMGLGSESRHSRAATQATRGLILSYQGGIVESLYASDRELTIEAHGDLGASMSQHGAQALARKGYRFSQILAKYYPGASLARLQRS